MTTDEKRAKIKEYCENSRTVCLSCPLHHRGGGCLTNDKVEENYKILEAAGVFKPRELVHLKGYIFDSLMYRYQLARERQLMYEIAKEGVDPKIARERFGRDVMRFGQILDEAMGEHD